MPIRVSCRSGPCTRARDSREVLRVRRDHSHHRHTQLDGRFRHVSRRCEFDRVPPRGRAPLERGINPVARNSGRFVREPRVQHAFIFSGVRQYSRTAGRSAAPRHANARPAVLSAAETDADVGSGGATILRVAPGSVGSLGRHAARLGDAPAGAESRPATDAAADWRGFSARGASNARRLHRCADIAPASAAAAFLAHGASAFLGIIDPRRRRYRKGAGHERRTEPGRRGATLGTLSGRCCTGQQADQPVSRQRSESESEEARACPRVRHGGLSSAEAR